MRIPAAWLCRAPLASQRLAGGPLARQWCGAAAGAACPGTPAAVIWHFQRPGGLLVGGEIAGTWRRAEAVMTVQPWRRLSPAERDAVVAEAESLPLPIAQGRITVRWND